MFLWRTRLFSLACVCLERVLADHVVHKSFERVEHLVRFFKYNKDLQGETWGFVIQPEPVSEPPSQSGLFQPLWHNCGIYGLEVATVTTSLHCIGNWGPKSMLVLGNESVADGWWFDSQSEETSVNTVKSTLFWSKTWEPQSVGRCCSFQTCPQYFS